MPKRRQRPKPIQPLAAKNRVTAKSWADEARLRYAAFFRTGSVLALREADACRDEALEHAALADVTGGLVFRIGKQVPSPSAVEVRRRILQRRGKRV